MQVCVDVVPPRMPSRACILWCKSGLHIASNPEVIGCNWCKKHSQHTDRNGESMLPGSEQSVYTQRYKATLQQHKLLTVTDRQKQSAYHRQE